MLLPPVLESVLCWIEKFLNVNHSLRLDLDLRVIKINLPICRI